MFAQPHGVEQRTNPVDGIPQISGCFMPVRWLACWSSCFGLVDGEEESRGTEDLILHIPVRLFSWPTLEPYWAWREREAGWRDHDPAMRNDNEHTTSLGWIKDEEKLEKSTNRLKGVEA